MEPSTAPAPEVPLSARRAEERFREVVDEVDVAAEELIALLKLVGAEFYDTARAALIVRAELLNDIVAHMESLPVRSLDDELGTASMNEQPQAPPLFEAAGDDSDDETSSDDESSQPSSDLSGGSGAAMEVEPSGTGAHTAPAEEAATVMTADAAATVVISGESARPAQSERSVDADVEPSALDVHQVMLDGGAYDPMALSWQQPFDPGYLAADFAAPVAPRFGRRMARGAASCKPCGRRRRAWRRRWERRLAAAPR